MKPFLRKVFRWSVFSFWYTGVVDVYVLSEFSMLSMFVYLLHFCWCVPVFGFGKICCDSACWCKSIFPLPRKNWEQLLVDLLFRVYACGLRVSLRMHLGLWLFCSGFCFYPCLMWRCFGNKALFKTRLFISIIFFRNSTCWVQHVVGFSLSMGSPKRKDDTHTHISSVSV